MEQGNHGFHSLGADIVNNVTVAIQNIFVDYSGKALIPVTFGINRNNTPPIDPHTKYFHSR